jgi:hypothetical protein
MHMACAERSVSVQRSRRRRPLGQRVWYECGECADRSEGALAWTVGVCAEGARRGSETKAPAREVRRRRPPGKCAEGIEFFLLENASMTSKKAKFSKAPSTLVIKNGCFKGRRWQTCSEWGGGTFGRRAASGFAGCRKNSCELAEGGLFSSPVVFQSRDKRQ